MHYSKSNSVFKKFNLSVNEIFIIGHTIWLIVPDFSWYLPQLPWFSLNFTCLWFSSRKNTQKSKLGESGGKKLKYLFFLFDFYYHSNQLQLFWEQQCPYRLVCPVDFLLPQFPALCCLLQQNQSHFPNQFFSLYCFLHSLIQCLEQTRLQTGHLFKRLL